METKLRIAAEFALAVALIAIAVAIYSHGNGQRYQLVDKGGAIFDSATGELVACQYTSEGRGGFADRGVRCDTVIPKRR